MNTHAPASSIRGAARIGAVARPGAEAVEVKGWLKAHKWLLLRRFSQLSILLLFLIGPWFGLWLVKGNLSSSLTLGVLPLTDPFVLLQSIAAGHPPYREAVLGGGIVLAFYLLLGGRLFCSWVCPINIVTDAAAWLRRRLGIKGGKTPHADTRYWLLGFTLVASFATGGIAWEWVNPVSMLHRGLIFGFGLSWGIVIGVFLYDLLLASRGWCGHVCPMGAFYGLVGKTALLRVTADKRSTCNDCMDCFAVCPEPQVIRPALKAVGQSHPVILDKDCTSCGRCIDVCSKDVFRLTTRFDRSES
ncbi:MAG: quinol dehydrogenase ferredoxin subunit NapH [Rhodocyclaceae bacterium]|uniref:quinol dehydrogenase ferredoxin subunit NapH n=1 Tax=Cognatazoarcus halotolerans TaxID=2686016 RepID=UPI00135916CF|nr:quinol dehydrogenase ferredoxin subunit NapH [Cognatazoarcus halotolerans]MBX3685486.1 quinol dehydrogenase ferredoxin subunit NapH [Rhodocyclaceae bacterium]MCB1910451.1 quinol dehydrogenase ferredoxin subunit NapH [Rhodocyclaceae bacterium]MCW5615803.1 quinol dehydrogenase ferredoxin subunit NapH [Rhodocyclaceae bacterium]